MNRKTGNHPTESALHSGLEETSRQDLPVRRKTWQQPILKKLDMRETLLGFNINPDGGPGYS
ncbi:MAG: hypothetical protein HPY82_06995 [Gammaproteobacteria bacterium]|nr:hypothetical protein [Gammaproteobacteria bacterium]